MEEIRCLLSQGMSSTEVIALGYKPPTGYKVRRQMPGKSQENKSHQMLARQIATGNYVTQGQAKILLLQQRIATLEAELAEADSLRSELEQARTRNDELEPKAQQGKALESQLSSLLGEVRSWQGKAVQTQKTLDAAERQLVEAREAIQALKPLSVWAGHPCCVCGEPTNGVLDRESAAKLLERTGHRDCLERAGLKRVTFRRFDSSANSSQPTVLADCLECPSPHFPFSVQEV